MTINWRSQWINPDNVFYTDANALKLVQRQTNPVKSY